LVRKIVATGIILLFIITSVSPIVIGYNSETRDIEQISKNIVFNKVDKHNYPEEYSTEKFNFIKHKNDVNSDELSFQKKAVSQFINKGFAGTSSEIVEEPMDSPWPMFMHDVRHTGRSPYSTADNPYDEKWYFTADGLFIGSTIIDDEGVIYTCLEDLYAIHPNGTLKWKYDDWYGTVDHAAPAIDENGTVYVGVARNVFNSNDFYAFYPNGTVKWIYLVGDDVLSSPAIGDDGVIYFGGGKNFYAVYPNGTLKWKYKAGDYFWGSSPAIGLDGTVYCGAHDNYVYAWYPNNGTVKWKFNTGDWVHASPTIGDNGTVYIVGGDRNLYALYPNNGTEKWRQKVGYVWGSPTLGVDGTIYVGVFEEKFYAIYPNGTIKWTFDAGGRIWFGNSAALSADGTLYFGTTPAMGGHGSDFIALNLDGTEKWRYSPGWYESSPAIGEDGTVYIVSSQSGDKGCLLAFGELDSSAPEAPSIDGETNGEAGVEYEYTFSTIDPNNDDVYYYIEWGDGDVLEWVGPYESGEIIELSHTWSEEDTYTISARAMDVWGAIGEWGTLEVEMPVNQLSFKSLNLLFQRILGRFNV